MVGGLLGLVVASAGTRILPLVGSLGRSPPDGVELDLPILVISLFATTAAEQRLVLTIFQVFTLIAVVLAVTGVYGMVASSVTSTTREQGIRVALGARSPGILARVMRQAAKITCVDLVVGMVAAAAASRAVAGLLFEAVALDPAVYASVACVFLTVAVRASLIPARRAIRIEPAATLRSE